MAHAFSSRQTKTHSDCDGDDNTTRTHTSKHHPPISHAYHYTPQHTHTSYLTRTSRTSRRLELPKVVQTQIEQRGVNVAHQ